MNMNDTILDTVATVESRNGKKVDYSNLPKLTEAQVSVHAFKNKRENGALAVTGYAVYVQAGGKWRHINEVLLHYGHKTVAPAQTAEAAEKTMAKVLAKWGREEVEKKERKSKKPSATATLNAILKATGLTLEEALQMVAENEKKAAA